MGLEKKNKKLISTALIWCILTPGIWIYDNMTALGIPLNELVVNFSPEIILVFMSLWGLIMLYVMPVWLPRFLLVVGLVTLILVFRPGSMSMQGMLLNATILIAAGTSTAFRQRDVA